MEPKNKLSQIDWNFPDSNRSESIHSIHPYPAKFIPEIPNAVLRSLNIPKDTWVFDPFCGSGVTLVEGLRNGYPSIGVDNNPIACLISRVKTTPSKDQWYKELGNLLTDIKQDNKSTILIPEIPNLDHWYDREIQIEISRILTKIQTIEDQYFSDLVKLALSSILVKISRQESDTRYAAKEKNIDPSSIINQFEKAAIKSINLISEFCPPTWEKKVLNKDILEVTKADINVPVGMVITSPPYPNAYEYWLYHKYRMYWLGYDPIGVKKKEIGARAHYFKKTPPTEEDFKKQLSKIFELISSVLIKDGYICFVIGRSRIHGKVIDNAIIVKDVAKLHGFVVLEEFTRSISRSRKSFNLSHANIKKENVIILKRNV